LAPGRTRMASLSEPGISELRAWIRKKIAQDRAHAEKENAVASRSDCLNADHDPSDMLAVADPVVVAAGLLRRGS
jgi:hypothetical protein